MGKSQKSKRQRGNDDPDFELGGGKRQHQRGTAATAAAAPATAPPAEALAEGGGDAAAAAAEQRGPSVAAATEEEIAAALNLDPAMLAAIAAAAPGQTALFSADGQPIEVTWAGEDLQRTLEQLQAAGSLIPLDEAGAAGMVAPLQQQLAAHERVQMAGIRQGDSQALAAAKRAGTLITLQYTLEPPPELEGVELGSRQGMIEVPQSGDVSQLKRLFMYQAHNQLLPGLQVLVTDDGREMADHDERGDPVAISAYGVTDGSHITLRIVIPEDVDELPLVEEAIVSSAFTTTNYNSNRGCGASRKTRWTQEQIEALVEGVERFGLSAWRSIVQDPRLAGKNNMQCKDKFRNLCLTIVQGRPERGLALDMGLKERVRLLIEQENIKF